MARWPAHCEPLLAMTGAAVPIVQAPMAGSGGTALAIAAMRGGAVGSLPAALLAPEVLRAQVAEVRAAIDGPLNLNFFCHSLPAAPDDSAWLALLAPYFAEEGVAPGAPAPLRRPFDETLCAVVEDLRPTMASFHFGLPAPALLDRVRAAGVRVMASATTVAEAHWLADRGCDAMILQGAEAGGHAGWFLGERHVPTPLATLLRERPAVPVIAAGGIVDGADMAAALRAGASAVQIGTAYLATPQSFTAPAHRALLGTPAAADTAFTNLLTGREARGIRNRLMRELGPIRTEAPAFPYASNALAPLRAKAEAEGRADYASLWAGAGGPRVVAQDAEALTRGVAQAALAALEMEHG